MMNIIKQLAAQLPVVMDFTHEVHFVDGAILIDQGQYDDDNGNKISTGIQYKQNFPVMMAANHERRLRKAYDKHGEQGILNYVNEIKTLAEKQKQSA